MSSDEQSHLYSNLMSAPTTASKSRWSGQDLSHQQRQQVLRSLKSFHPHGGLRIPLGLHLYTYAEACTSMGLRPDRQASGRRRFLLALVGGLCMWRVVDGTPNFIPSFSLWPGRRIDPFTVAPACCMETKPVARSRMWSSVAFLMTDSRAPIRGFKIAAAIFNRCSCRQETLFWTLEPCLRRMCRC